MISVSEVCVHRRSTVCLAPCSLKIQSASVLALVGANGSGKTTLLHLLAGIIKPTDGIVDGSPRVSFVAQDQSHHSWMPISVDEVLKMGRYRGLLHRLRSEDRIAIDTAAERLKIAHLRSRRFSELSGGERQRVIVARAIASSADLVLLDEPITGLDLPSQEIILQVIAEEAARGASVVFSTHHLGEARNADRVALLAGCVIADGTPEETLTPALLSEAFGSNILSDQSGTVVIDEHNHVSGLHPATQLSCCFDSDDHSHHDHSHGNNLETGLG